MAAQLPPHNPLVLNWAPGWNQAYANQVEAILANPQARTATTELPNAMELERYRLHAPGIARRLRDPDLFFNVGPVTTAFPCQTCAGTDRVRECRQCMGAGTLFSLRCRPCRRGIGAQRRQLEDQLIRRWQFPVCRDCETGLLGLAWVHHEPCACPCAQYMQHGADRCGAHRDASRQALANGAVLGCRGTAGATALARRRCFQWYGRKNGGPRRWHNYKKKPWQYQKCPSCQGPSARPDIMERARPTDPDARIGGWKLRPNVVLRSTWCAACDVLVLRP